MTIGYLTILILLSSFPWSLSLPFNRASFQCSDQDKIDKKPSKIIWDVPWEELLALELAKVRNPRPSHLIIHLKNFRKSESFVRLIRCNTDEDEDNEPQAVTICSSVRKTWKANQTDKRVIALKVSFFFFFSFFQQYHTHFSLSFSSIILELFRGFYVYQRFKCHGTKLCQKLAGKVRAELF